MESRLLDRFDSADVDTAEQGFWTLWDERLRCHPNFTTPDRSQMESGKYDVIMCYDEGELVGLMCVRPDTHGIYYPVMTGDMAAVLNSMCAFAQDTYDTLTAVTDNEYIHYLLSQTDRPFEYDDKHVIVWSR